MYGDNAIGGDKPSDKRTTHARPLTMVLTMTKPLLIISTMLLAGDDAQCDTIAYMLTTCQHNVDHMPSQCATSIHQGSYLRSASLGAQGLRVPYMRWYVL